MKKLRIILYLSIFTIFILGCSEQEVSSEDANGNNLESNDIVISNEQFKVAGIELGTLTKQNFSDKIFSTGTIDLPPQNRAFVSSYFGGTVSQINLLVGDKVRKGQLLFKLVNPEFINIQEEFLRAKNSLKFLEAEYQRQKQLSDANVSSKKMFLKSEMDYLTTQSQYEALIQKLKLLNIDYTKLNSETISNSVNIVSPLNGFISEINISLGQILSANEAAIEVVDPDHLHIELNVFEKDIRKIKIGDAVNFSLPDVPNETYTGKVVLVGKTVNPDDRTIRIHCHFDDESIAEKLVPGMFINAYILVDKDEANALATDAIVDVDNEYYSLVLKETNDNGYVFKQQKLLVGRSTDDFTEITNSDELGKDSKIIVKGAFNLIQ
ncbi:MAG: efflux RND transporter periplasmic adaptor subunit [Ignavibacteriales bacterium]|nr:efflux RND transporter periplasmic adaptor subunit [Ignavibacteriales bacterium]